MLRSKVFYLFLATLSGCVGGWALQYITSMPPILAALIAVVAFMIMAFAIKRAELLNAPQSAIKAERRLTLLDKLENILPKIENEYKKLGDKAIEYPLNEYERRYLLIISDYKRMKARNAITSAISNSSDFIIKALCYFYKKGIPYLKDLEENEISNNPNSILKQLKNIQEQIDDVGLSKGLIAMQKGVFLMESVRVLYGLYKVNGVLLSTEDIMVNETQVRDVNDELIEVKRLSFQKIDYLRKRGKLWIWLFG